MNILKTLQRLESGSWKVFWERDYVENIERLQMRAKSFENALKKYFFCKVAGAQPATLLKNKLHYKHFSWFIYLLRTTAYHENFKEKNKNFEMQCILC